MFPDVNDLLCCRLNMHSSFPVRTAADDDFQSFTTVSKVLQKINKWLKIISELE